MNKKTSKKTNAEKIGKDMTRRERWAVHAKAVVDGLRTNKIMIPVKWLEEIEGRPLDEVVVDLLSSRRPDWERKYDDAYEAASTQSRNAHEKNAVRMEVIKLLMPYAQMIDRKDLHEFIRRFYRAGDRGIGAAIARAVKVALKARA